MNKIQANASGTRSIEVSDKHLQTLKKYSLLKNLIDSNGIIDEDVLDKLKFNCRSILESQPTVDKELMDLCLDVIYNNNMKTLTSFFTHSMEMGKALMPFILLLAAEIEKTE